MEELGASKLTRPSAMSKSSEQLDQLWRHSSGPGGPDGDKRNVSFFAEVREAQGQERGRKRQYVLDRAGKEPAIIGQKNAQGQTQNHAQKKSPLKQNSEPVLGSAEDATSLTTVGTRNSSRSTSPASRSSSRARVHSASPGFHASVTNEIKSSRPTSETSSNPPSPRGQETSEREAKSSSSTAIQTKPPCENRLSSR